MMRKGVIHRLILGLAFVGCFNITSVHAASMPPADNHAATKVLIEDSIKTVNHLVEADRIKLTLDAERPTGHTQIPIYIVRSKVLAEVPPNCACILVSGSAVRTLLVQLKASILFSDKALAMEQAGVLMAVVFLHELGHIRNGDHGAFLRRDTLGFVNLKGNADKDKELAADDFVIERLVCDSRCIKIENETNEVRMRIGFGLAAYLLDIGNPQPSDCLGGRILGLRCAFWDHGQSHPNFEYRLHRIAAAISGSATAELALEDFENVRERGARLIIVGPNGKRRVVEDGSVEYDELSELVRKLLEIAPIAKGN